MKIDIGLMTTEAQRAVILRLLTQRESVDARELAEITGCWVGRAQALLTGCQHRGWVMQIDGRYRLTPAGQQHPLATGGIARCEHCLEHIEWRGRYWTHYHTRLPECDPASAEDWPLTAAPRRRYR